MAFSHSHTAHIYVRVTHHAFRPASESDGRTTGEHAIIAVHAALDSA